MFVYGINVIILTQIYLTVLLPWPLGIQTYDLLLDSVLG